MKGYLKTALIILSGFLTGMLSFIIPVGGGGISLIFTLTIPFFIILGIILGVIYYVFIQKMKNIYCKNITFLAMLFLIITLTFAWYPYR